MSQHYYSKNPQTTSKPQEWAYTLRGEKIQFQTDSGVFSKNEVDFGSRLLIEAFEDSSVEGEAMTHLMRLDTKLRSGEVAQQCDSVVRFSELITKYPLPVIVSTALLKLADLFKNW